MLLSNRSLQQQIRGEAQLLGEKYSGVKYFAQKKVLVLRRKYCAEKEVLCS